MKVSRLFFTDTLTNTFEQDWGRQNKDRLFLDCYATTRNHLQPYAKNNLSDHANQQTAADVRSIRRIGVAKSADSRLHFLIILKRNFSECFHDICRIALFFLLKVQFFSGGYSLFYRRVRGVLASAWNSTRRSIRPGGRRPLQGGCQGGLHLSARLQTQGHSCFLVRILRLLGTCLAAWLHTRRATLLS